MKILSSDCLSSPLTYFSVLAGFVVGHGMHLQIMNFLFCHHACDTSLTLTLNIQWAKVKTKKKTVLAIPIRFCLVLRGCIISHIGHSSYYKAH